MASITIPTEVVSPVLSVIPPTATIVSGFISEYHLTTFIDNCWSPYIRCIHVEGALTPVTSEESMVKIWLFHLRLQLW